MPTGDAKTTNARRAEPSECGALFDALSGAGRLMEESMYGAGLRLMELLRLRVQDLDIERGRLMVRAFDRSTRKSDVIYDRRPRQTPANGSSKVEHSMSQALAIDAARARASSAATRWIADARSGSASPRRKDSPAMAGRNTDGRTNAIAHRAAPHSAIQICCRPPP
jgi:integrase